MNFRLRALLASLIPPLSLAACSQPVTTDTQANHLVAVADTIDVSPSPVLFGEVPMGTTKEVSVYLKTVEIGNFEYLRITNTTSSGGLVTVKFYKQLEQGDSVDCEAGEFGRKYLSCKMIFTLNLNDAGARSEGVGTITLEAQLWSGPVVLGNFLIEVPYKWGAPVAPTDTSPSLTTIVSSTAAPTTVPATSPSLTTIVSNTSSSTTIASTDTSPSLTTIVSNTAALTTVPDTSPSLTTIVSSTAAPTTVPATSPAATPAIAVSPSEYDFGSVPYRTAPRDFVVTNSGGGTLRFTSFRFVLGDQFFYTIRNTCQGADLAAGQSCIVSIEVSSGGPDISPPPGDHADTMNIVSNGGTTSISLRYTTPG